MIPYLKSQWRFLLCMTPILPFVLLLYIGIVIVRFFDGVVEGIKTKQS